jgi:hypothetical protein
MHAAVISVTDTSVNGLSSGCQNLKAHPIPKLAGLTYRVVAVDGKIHAAEAILETLPIGAPSGW